MKTKTRSSSPFKVQVRLEGRTMTEDLVEGLDIPTQDFDALDEALATHPGKYAYWAALEAAARGEFEREKARVDLLESDLFRRVSRRLNQEAVDNSSKAPTLDAIRSECARNKALREAKEVLQDKKEALDRISVGRQAMQHRKDVLLELARNFRAELEYGLSTGVKKPTEKTSKARQRMKDMVRGGKTRREENDGERE